MVIINVTVSYKWSKEWVSSVLMAFESLTKTGEISGDFK